MTIHTATEKYLVPESLQEAFNEISNNPSFTLVAGATDVMLNKHQGNVQPGCIIDISRIAELKEIKTKGGFLHIGARVSLADIIQDPGINQNFRLLADAAKLVASPQIRNQASLGGNILCENRCVYYNQSELWREAAGYCLKCGGDICLATGGKKSCLSKFVSDMAPALICMNAQAILDNGRSEKTIAVEDLYTGDGIHSKNIEKGMILKYFRIPTDQNLKTSIKKLRQRKSLEFTSLTLALSINNRKHLKVAASGIAPQPVVLSFGEEDDFDRILMQVNKKARIVDNDFFDRNYRKSMLKVFLQDGLKEIREIPE